MRFSKRKDFKYKNQQMHTYRGAAQRGKHFTPLLGNSVRHKYSLKQSRLITEQIGEMSAGILVFLTFIVCVWTGV